MPATAADNVLQAVPPALTFLVPLVALALFVLALTHRPATAHRGFQRGRKDRLEAIGAYVAIAALAVLSTIYGALGLRTALGESDGVRGKGELVAEALIFLEVGAAVLYFATQYTAVARQVYWLSVLVVELVCATLIYLVLALVPHTRVTASASPALCVLFIGTVIPFLLLGLRVHTSKHRTNNAQTERNRTPSFSGTRLSIDHCSPRSSSDSEPSHRKCPSVTSTSDLTVTVVNHPRLQPPPAYTHTRQPDVEYGSAPNAANLSPLGLRATDTRSTSLLVFLLVSQVAAFVAFVLEIAAVSVAYSVVTSNSGPPPVTKRSSVYAILQILRTALMVVCITGVMAAFLLHAYNAYLRVSSPAHPSRTGESSGQHTVDMSRMNPIAVSFSTVTCTSPPTPAKKGRNSAQLCPPSAFERNNAKKFCIDEPFTGIALSAVRNQVVLTNTNGGDRDASRDVGYFTSRTPFRGLARHKSSPSLSSSFECPTSKKMTSAVLQSFPLHNPVRDSKFDDDEPGYAYIYTEKQLPTDPLDVGLPVPFKAELLNAVDHEVPGYCFPKAHLSFDPANQSSRFSNAVKKSPIASVQTISPPQTPTAPINIPLPKTFTNPYPTPQSTPTSTSFLNNPAMTSSLTASPTQPSPQSATSSTTSISSTPKRSASVRRLSSQCERIGRDLQRRYSQCMTPTRSRETTPTPTRAPTPGLGFTPFIGTHVRKRDSTGSNSASPPSSFMANLKGRAKNLSKHDSIAQGLEGIRNGLGTTGKTKYPLRSSNSHSSLGLGISNTFRLPQLTRRASEVERGSNKRNRSSVTLEFPAETESVHEVDEGDFMDLRDPFASPSKGSALRIVTPEELNLRSGRESRIGHREDDLFDVDKEGYPWTASISRSRGARMSAWGGHPGIQSIPNSPVRPSSPSTPRVLNFKTTKSSGEKPRNKTLRNKTSTRSEGDSSDHSDLQRISLSFDDANFALEEALLTQQLLKRLSDENR